MDAGFLTTIIVIVLLLVDFVIRVIAIIVVPRNRKPVVGHGLAARDLPHPVHRRAVLPAHRLATSSPSGAGRSRRRSTPSSSTAPRAWSG